MIATNIPNFSPNGIVKAKVGLYNGSTLIQECTCGDYLQDFSVRREGANNKFFGFGICHSLDISLIDINGSLIDRLSSDCLIKIQFSDDNLIYWDEPFPTFHTEKMKVDRKNGIINISAFDDIGKLSRYTINDLPIAPPYRVRDLFSTIGRMLFKSVAPITEHPNLDLYYEKGGNYEGTETLREVLNHIAELTGSVYYITADDTLVLKSLSTKVRDVEKGDYYELVVSTPKTLNGVCHATELGDNITASSGDGVTQFIRDNPLIELRTDIPTVVNNILDTVFGSTRQQFELDWSGDYRLEPWDVIEVETDTGDLIECVIINDTIEYGGAISGATSWEYSESEAGTESNPTTLTEVLDKTFAKVDRLNKEITLYVGEIESTIENSVTTKVEEKASEILLDVDGIEQRVTKIEKTTSDLETSVTTQMAEIETTVSGITASVSSITQVDNAQNEQIAELENRVDATMTNEEFEIRITEILADGVDKVTTVTGFTFDSEGLHIEKTDSAMNSTLDEDGLVVSRYDTPVLTAKSDGVNALNIAVRQYLTVGGSRFEKYKNSRTGCFWIGD